MRKFEVIFKSGETEVRGMEFTDECSCCPFIHDDDDVCTITKEPLENIYVAVGKQCPLEISVE